jgi:hypothetical protein
LLILKVPKTIFTNKQLVHISNIVIKIRKQPKLQVKVITGVKITQLDNYSTKLTTLQQLKQIDNRRLFASSPLVSQHPSRKWRMRCHFQRRELREVGTFALSASRRTPILCSADFVHRLLAVGRISSALLEVCM